jgi:hypothetical protein
MGVPALTVGYAVPFWVSDCGMDAPKLCSGSFSSGLFWVALGGLSVAENWGDDEYPGGA